MLVFFVLISPFVILQSLSPSLVLPSPSPVTWSAWFISDLVLLAVLGRKFQVILLLASQKITRKELGTKTYANPRGTLMLELIIESL